MPKICFVELYTYAVLNPAHGGTSPGGEAVQHSLLAREFANQGWSVGAVCLDFGQPDGDLLSGIQVWKTYQSRAGLPGIRFLYPRLYKVWNALHKADADIYFQSCAGYMTGVVARFAKRHSRKMIFRVAHDSDCIPGKQLINFSRDRWIYEYGLRSADLISAQSNVQADALWKYYGLSTARINMVAEIPEDSSDIRRDIDVLWVNNFRPFKRPELVCQIARNMPDVSFTMVGGKIRGHEELYCKVKEEALTVPNIRFVGAVPYHEVNRFFARAKLFLNTSDSEGFPNSFLQAWVRRVPVVSYFDPDGLIASHGLGVSVETQADFHGPLTGLLQSDERRCDIGERACRFVINRYSSRTVVNEYERLMSNQFGIGLGRA